MPFVVEGPLSEQDNAAQVVEALHMVAGHLPVLKLDVTLDQATLNALTPDEQVVTYRWADDAIDAVTSDFQYLGQATFNPADYPLASIGRMFDVADLRGVHGDPIYQIQEYREGQVLQTVSSLPESTTVFFLKDGSAVPDLTVTSALDIADGFEAVTGGETEINQFGFSPERGYWADLPGDEGQIVRRTRTGGVPPFDAPRTELNPLPTFSPEVIDPAVVAMVLARVRTEPTEACTVTVDLALERSAPVITAVCGTETYYADLEGRDMTDLIG